jgi:hypothetical protein
MTDVDIRASIAPKSNQLNADDLIGQPRTIRVTTVKAWNAEQPIAIHFEGDNGNPYLPCKSMRRVLVAAWGDRGADWIGRSMTLYQDPEVIFGGVKVGGIRISHLSHIDEPRSILLTTTRSKRKPYLVKPLKADEGPQKDRQPKYVGDDVDQARLYRVLRHIEASTTQDQLLAAVKAAEIDKLPEDLKDHARAVYLERRDALANQE